MGTFLTNYEEITAVILFVLGLMNLMLSKKL